MPNPKSPIAERAAWLPLIFVVVALGLLLVTPIVVGSRVAALRRDVDERSRSRVLLNDLEAAGATQALIGTRRPRPGHPDTIALSLARSLSANAADDEHQLDSLFRTATPEARADLATIDSIERVWRDARSGDSTHAAARSNEENDPLRLLATAERLDARLSERLDATRAESMRLQRINIISAIVLTPIALLSALAVWIAERRARLLAAKLEAEREALAQSLESRAALMRGITHDLKNPLGAASGFTDLLLDGIGSPPLLPEQATKVERIRKLLHQSTATISSLVQFAADNARDRLRVEPVPTEICGLVREIADDYAAAARERGIALDVDASGADIIIATDANHVRHILGNLLSNAVKYTPSSGRIRVRVSSDVATRVLRVAVRDSGPGVQPENRERIFDEFFRGEAARSKVDGSGVGLAISRRLARLLGGDLTLADGTDAGATFVLSLPLA